MRTNRRGWYSVVVPALLWGSLGAAPAQDREARLARSQELIRQGQYRGALALLDRLKAEDPEDARCYFLTGMALLESGYAHDSLSELERALALDPGSAEFSLLYGEALARLGQKEQAADAVAGLEDGDVLQVLSARELWLVSDILYRVGKHERALRVLDRYEAVTRGDDPGVELRRGEISIESRDLDRAVRALRRYVERVPDDALGHYGLGRALSLQGRFQQARDALDRAVELDPSSIDAVYELGVAELSLGNPAAAIKILQRVEETEGPRILEALARAYREAGRLQRAQEYMREAREARTARESRARRERAVEVFITRGKDLMTSGRLAAARKEFEKALEQDEGSWLAHSYMARVLIASNLWRSAYPHLIRMEEIRPDAFEGKWLMAEYWRRRGDQKQAAAYAEAARERQPNRAPLRNLLGNIYFDLGREVEALAEYRAATRLQPDRVDFRLNYETLARKLGKQ